MLLPCLPDSIFPSSDILPRLSSASSLQETRTPCDTLYFDAALPNTLFCIRLQRYIVLPTYVAKLTALLRETEHCMVSCTDILAQSRDIGEISRCSREISARYLGAAGGEISERICSCRASSNLLTLLRAGAGSRQEKLSAAQLLSPTKNCSTALT